MNRRLLPLAFSLPLLLTGCVSQASGHYPPPPSNATAEAARMGFHDGFEAAQRDIRDNHPPDFADRQRYRRPPVPGDLTETYRRGYADGYNRALHPGGPPPAY